MMSFFRGLKRAFGFTDDGNERDDELDGVDGNASREPYVNPFKEQAGGRGEMEKRVASDRDDVTPAAVNGDSTGSSQALIDDLTSVIATHMESFKGDDSTALRSLEEKLKMSEAQRLSLKSRTGVLASRVAQLEGEQEQLELEKKSLLNKIKVMQVKAGDGERPASGDGDTREIDALAAEYKGKMDITTQLLKDLRADAAAKARKIEELKSQLAGDNPLEAQLELKEKEIEELKLNLAQANSDLEVAAKVEKKIDEFDQYKKRKEKEIGDLKSQFDELHRRDTATMNDMRDQLSKAEVESAKLKKLIDSQQKQASDTAAKHNRRDIDLANRIDDLKQQLHLFAAKNEQQRREIEQNTAHAREREALILALQQERDNFSCELEKLKMALNEANEKVSKLREETDSDAMSGRQPSHDRGEEPELKREVELAAIETTDTVPLPVDEEEGLSLEHVAEIPQEPISPSIDMDDIDWLVPSPPAPELIEEPEEPAPHKIGGGDRQLSLF